MVSSSVVTANPMSFGGSESGHVESGEGGEGGEGGGVELTHGTPLQPSVVTIEGASNITVISAPPPQ